MKKFTKELGPGWITLVENDDYALCRLIFGDGLEVDCDEEETPLLKKGFQQIQEYWTGHRVIFTLPLAPGGSDFEREVWETVIRIPYGEHFTTPTLLAALALGILIYLVYRKFYTGVVYSRSFAVTLVGMCVLTCMVTLAISTNVVISLGMVGALSIVRFRTAVKDPLDLLYLFWSITTGITAGAGMYALGLVTAAVMIAMIYLFSHWQAKGRVYIAVIHYVGTEAGDDIVRALGRIKYAVKSKTMRGENTEMAVEVFCKDPNMEFADRIRAVKGVQDVTLIQYNGEYHG